VPHQIVELKLTEFPAVGLELKVKVASSGGVEPSTACSRGRVVWGCGGFGEFGGWVGKEVPGAVMVRLKGNLNSL